MLARTLRVRSPQAPVVVATRRTSQISRHMMSTSSQVSDEVCSQLPEQALVLLQT